MEWHVCRQFGETGYGRDQRRRGLFTQSHERTASFGHPSQICTTAVKEFTRSKRKGRLCNTLAFTRDHLPIKVPWFPAGEGTATKPGFPTARHTKGDKLQLDAYGT